MGIHKRRNTVGKLRYRARVQHRGDRALGPWRQKLWKAREDETAMKRAIAQGTWDQDYGPDRVPLFEEVVPEYLIDCENRLGRRSYRAIKRHLENYFQPRFEGWRIDRIKFIHAKRAQADLRGRLAGPTVNRYMSSLSGCFKFARPHIEANPCAGVRRYAENDKAWYAVTEDEAEHLIATAYKDTNPNMGPLLRLLWESALRSKSEARTIHLENINWDWQDRHGNKRGLIAFVGKGGDVEGVPMSERLRDELRSYVDAHGNQEWLFPGRFGTNPINGETMYRAWGRVLKAAEFPKIRLHDFRHGRATHLIDVGARPDKVQALLRHKTRTMMDRYVHMTQDHAADALIDAEQALREADKVVDFWRSGTKSGTRGKRRGSDES